MPDAKIGYIISVTAINEPIDVPCSIITNTHELPSNGCHFIILNSKSPLFNQSLISELRQKDHYQLTPLYYLGDESAELNQITDGQFSIKALAEADAIHEKIKLLAEINRLNLHDLEHLMICYAYVRGDLILSCALDFQKPAGFYYPLINVFSKEANSITVWQILEDMEAKKLISHHQLVDELQACTHCHSGLLNFKTCCPSCESSKINTQPFVHCFACGNMGPQSEFMQQNRLICARCNNILRHIGIDYDKPLEDKICQNCNFYFFEGSVNALCLVCKKLTRPDQLESRKLYDYILTARGKALAQGETGDLSLELGHFLKLIDLKIFMMIIKWQLLLVKRHKNTQFSVVALRITNEQELISNYGLLRTESMLIQFFERARTLLRDTDLVTRDNSVVLFFLPMTDIPGCTVLIERINSFAKTQLIETTQLALKTTMIHSKEIMDRDIDLDVFLNELYNRAPHK
jgi:hypothetical protein